MKEDQDDCTEEKGKKIPFICYYYVWHPVIYRKLSGLDKKDTKTPGAARFGNFINYYQFNPPENRLLFLPEDLISTLSPQDSSVDVLDIGCNAGVS